MASSSFDETLLAHRSWLRSVIRSRVREVEAADDLVNDVLAEAIAHRAGDTIRDMAPWLYRVAIRKVLQFRRSSARRRKHTQAFAEEAMLQAESRWLEQPIEVMLGDEQHALMRKAIRNLSGQDAEILLLKYVHHWNYQQLATHLGLSHSKVTHRLRRARSRMKIELGRLGLGEQNE